MAKAFGISDVALKKHCTKLNIPVPGVGYWQRKAAGQPVRVKRLPRARPEDPVDTEIRGQIVAADAVADESESGPVWEQEQFEDRPENRIVVAATLRKPHPLVRKTSDILRGLKPRHPDSHLSDWRPTPRLDIDVSDKTLGRALRVMDALVKALDKRGFSVACGGENEPKAFTTILGQKIPFGIREPLKRGEPRTSFGYVTQTLVRTGKLALVVRHTYGHYVRRQWNDTKTGKIEDDLNDFIVLLVAFAVHEKERHEKFLREEAEREARRERARQEAERRAIEAERLARLRVDAANWAEAERMRAFLAAIEARTPEPGDGPAVPEKLKMWLAWARAAADALDPLAGAEIRGHLPDANEADWDEEADDIA